MALNRAVVPDLAAPMIRKSGSFFWEAGMEWAKATRERIIYSRAVRVVLGLWDNRMA